MGGLHHAVSTVHPSLQPGHSSGTTAFQDATHAALTAASRQDLHTDTVTYRTDGNVMPVTNIPYLLSDDDDVVVVVNGTGQAGGGVNGTDFADVQSFLHQQNLQFLASLTPTLVYLVFIMVVGTVGNSVVLVVHYRRFRPSVTRTYILAVSVCALLTTSLSLPAELVEMRFHATYTATWACKLSRSVKSFFSFLAACILVAVALERHRKICGPYFRRAGSAASASAGWNLQFCVLFSALITLPYSVLTGPQKVRLGDANVTGFCCSVSDAYVTSTAFFCYSMATGLTFIICFVIICVSYVRIGRLIWRHQRRRRASASRRVLPPVKHVRGTEGNNDLPVIHIQSDVDGGGDDVRRNDTSDIRPKEQVTAESDATTHPKGGDHLSPKPDGEKENTFQNARHHLVVVCREPDSVSSDYSSLQPIQMSTATSTQRDAENELSTLMNSVNETSTSEGNYTPQPRTTMMSGKARGREHTGSVSSVSRLRADLSRRLVVLGGGHALRQDPSITQNETSQGVDKASNEKQNRTDSFNNKNRKRRHKPVSASSRPSPSSSSSKSLRQIPTRTTLTMFVLTVVCVFVNYFPYMLIVSLGTHAGRLKEAITENGYHICLRSYFVYTVLNPLVVGFCSARFRRECRHLFTVRSK